MCRAITPTSRCHPAAQPDRIGDHDLLVSIGSDVLAAVGAILRVLAGLVPHSLIVEPGACARIRQNGQ